MRQNFQPDIELDAALVSASMRFGVDGFLATALRLGFKSTNEAMNRAAWLKKQSKRYLDKVARHAADLEAGGR